MSQTNKLMSTTFLRNFAEFHLRFIVVDVINNNDGLSLNWKISLQMQFSLFNLRSRYLESEKDLGYLEKTPLLIHVSLINSVQFSVYFSFTKFSILLIFIERFRIILI